MHLTYPHTPHSSDVDTYFGQQVADPYRWLEDDNAPAVIEWTKEQQATTESFFSQIPYRDKVKARLTTLIDYPKIVDVYQTAKYLFFSKNDGLQPQAVIYIQEGRNGTPRVLLDPNTFSTDGTTAVSLLSVSPDSRYATFSISKAGSDWSEIYVMDIDSGEMLSDHLPWVKFSDATWWNDGFFYIRYPAPEADKAYSAKSSGSAVYYHQLGTTAEEDQRIFEMPEQPNRYFITQITPDNAFLILYVRSGTDGFETHFKALDEEGWDFKPLVTGFSSKNYVLSHQEGRFLVASDLDAPNKKVVWVDIAHPSPEHWVSVIEESQNVIENVVLLGQNLILTTLEDATSRIYRYDLAGNLLEEIGLPTLGSVYLAGGHKDVPAIVYFFTSFTYPTTVFYHEIGQKNDVPFHQPKLSFSPEEYVANQHFFKSKDGTRVPMFVVHKKGIALDGKRPTYLYGYGGFSVNLTPFFSASSLVFLEQGGVMAIPNLRGGGEYGEKWHREGMLFKKHKVFEDFISAGEYLIEAGFTNQDRLAIAGGSNGGLLVGACANMRPDLFKAVIAAVGVMDMLRYHKFTVGWGWIPEYGSSEENQEMFQYLYSYSPLHNISPDNPHPATLVMTADHDDRVVPAHSFKYAAALQQISSGDSPKLLRVAIKAGHGAGKPIEKVIEDETDKWCFIFSQLAVNFD